MFADIEDNESIVTGGRTLNNVAKIYDLLSPLMTFGQEGRFSKKIVELLEHKEDRKILDVGCGTGTPTIYIANAFYKEGSFIIGLDAAPKMIEVARKKIKNLKNIRFDIGIAEKLPYASNFFDCVISTFFFHHVNFELKKKCLQEIWRVLKVGGKTVIVDVDTPTSLFGAICAWSGYWIFNQEEIKENIQGKLREAFNLSDFRSWTNTSSHLGYISIFELIK